MIDTLDEFDADDVADVLRKRASCLHQDRKLPMFSLAQAVGMTAGRKCRVSHDHVYGLLGYTRKQITVD